MGCPAFSLPTHGESGLTTLGTTKRSRHPGRIPLDYAVLRVALFGALSDRAGGLGQRNQAKRINDGVQATIIPSRKAWIVLNERPRFRLRDPSLALLFNVR